MIFSAIGSFYGAVAVMLGAFAAHALKDKLDAYQLGLIETAAKYLMYHALALLAAGIFYERGKSKLLLAAGVLLAIGNAVFSVSLGLIVFTEQKFWGAITPLGGLMLISGWLCLALNFTQFRERKG